MDIKFEGKNWEILGWDVDVEQDRKIRAETKQSGYDPSCPTGYTFRNGECLWDPPRVITAQDQSCPTGYNLKDNSTECLWDGKMDPFFVSLM
jgi:hypothetical protein